MRKCLTLLFVSILLWSCSEAQFEDTADVSASVLSAEIIDDTPYPLEIMRQAVNEVMAESATRSTVPELKPTHRYIEFIPATFEEYYRLWGEENIDCIPASALDTSNLTEENSFVAVIRKENEGPEKLYALVANDVTLPDYIAYKVLTELYTPYAADSGIADGELSKQIAQRAEILSNETREIVVGPVKKVIPRGTITIADRYAGKTIPLANVSVTIIYKAPAGDFDIVTTEVVKTDGNGYFTSAKSYEKRYVSFSIAWRQGRISIADSSENVASTIGLPDSSGEWNPIFGDTEFTPSMRNYYASMYRAVNSVFNGGTDVLSNNNHYIRLCAADEAGTGNSATSFAPDASTGLYPKAIIKCGNKDSYEIMDYTCYELGRMCMYAINPTRYIAPWQHITDLGRNETIKRSWGAFAAFYFLGKEAERVGTVEKLHTMITYNGNKVQKPDFYNRQDWQCTWTIVDYHHLPIFINTPIFIDLYDSFDQYKYYVSIGRINNKYPEDSICMPDFSTIRDIAYGCNSINDVCNRVKDPKYQRRYLYTQEDINKFFDQWTYGLYTHEEEYQGWPYH